MIWAILAIYLLIGDVISRYYTRRLENKYIIIGRKARDMVALKELLIFFFWLPFLFLIGMVFLQEKSITITKTIKKRIEVSQKIKKATLRRVCKGPLGLCDSVKYDCSKCQSINQLDALEKIYGRK